MGYARPTSDIADSNAIVQSRADANDYLERFKGEFRALVSTQTVDARDNTGTAPVGASYTTGEGVPIYWVKGDKAADDYDDFYDGSWDSTAWKTENGDQTVTGGGFEREVWSGSAADGTKHASNYAGASQVRYGWLGNNMAISQNTSGLRSSGNGLAYYGLSPVFTVVADSQFVPDYWPHIPPGRQRRGQLPPAVRHRPGISGDLDEHRRLQRRGP